MRKLFLVTSLFTLACFAQQPTIYQEYGMKIYFDTNGGSAQTLNTAASGGYSATWLAYGFVPTVSDSVVKLRAYLHAITGSLGTTDLVCDLYSDSSGSPGSSIATSNTLTSTASAPGWVEFISFSASPTLTAFTQYWVVLRNANASPTSNYPTYSFNVQAGVLNLPTSSVQTTANSGGSWTKSTSNPYPIIRIQYTGGTYQGYVIETINVVAGGALNANHKIHSTVEAGVTFTTPTVQFSAIGCGFLITKVGTPTGNLQCELISDNGSTVSIVATSTSAYTPSQVATVQYWSAFYFSSPVTLSASTKYRMVLVESTQSDTSSNYYGANTTFVANDANSLALLPAQGTWRGTYCAATCGTRANWTDDPSNAEIGTLLLNPAGEFVSSGGGGASTYPIGQ